MIPHLLSNNPSSETEDSSRSCVVTNRDHVKQSWSEGCFGSSTRSTRFKPAFLDSKKRKGSDDQEESLQLNLMEAAYLKESRVIIEGFSDDYLATFRNRYSGCSIGFDERYQAYKKFRAAKWIPKNGAQYGCDYVLYDQDPDSCHSRYCVTLLDDRKQRMPIRALSRSLRAAEQTRKRMVLCNENGDCIQLRRWVLKHEQATPEQEEEHDSTSKRKKRIKITK